MHWLTMRLERLIAATELFATFRQSVLGPTTDAEALIRELVADAAVMRSFDRPTPNTPEAEFFGASLHWTRAPSCRSSCSCFARRR